MKNFSAILILLVCFLVASAIAIPRQGKAAPVLALLMTAPLSGPAKVAPISAPALFAPISAPLATAPVSGHPWSSSEKSEKFMRDSLYGNSQSKFFSRLGLSFRVIFF